MQQSILTNLLIAITVLSTILFVGSSQAESNQKYSPQELVNVNQEPIIKASLSARIRPLSPNFVCSNVNAVRVNSWSDRNYWGAVNELNPAMIRIPGGEGSGYWDWRKGGIVEDLGNLPEGVSHFLDNDQDRRYNASKLKDLQPGFVENNKIPIFVLNLLSDNLSSQLEMLRTARDLGIPVKYVELGNEFYFPLANYVSVFPQPEDYAKTANRWIAAIKKEFPNAEVAVLGVARTSKRKSSRVNRWNREIIANSLPFSDAVTVHTYGRNGLVNRPIKDKQYPFFKSEDIRFILGEPFRNWQKVSRIISIFPQKQKIWVTEYNVTEDIHAKSGAKQQRIVGSWIHGMYTLSMSLLFLEDPRIELACNHMLIGSSQFATILSPKKSFISPDGQDRKVQPWALSANGNTHKLLGNALEGMTKAQKIYFDRQETLIGNNNTAYPTLYGWKFSNKNAESSLLTNLSNQPIELDITSLFSSTPQYEITYGSPQALVTNSEILKKKTGKAEDKIVLPPYSVTKFSNNYQK